MATKKPTKAQMYSELLEDLHASGITAYDDFIAHEVELISKKRSSGKATPAQEHSEKIKLVLRDIMTEPARVADLASNPEMKACTDKDGNAPSANKVLSVLTKMVADGEAVRTEEKKIAYYSLAE